MPPEGPGSPDLAQGRAVLTLVAKQKQGKLEERVESQGCSRGC